MIYADFARPAPSPEIVKRLKQVDDRLDLKFFSWPHRDGPNVNRTENWAIIQRWAHDSPRRKMIQLGQMSEGDDYDVLAWLPVDCGVEQAYDYFQRACRGRFRDNKDVEYCLNNLHKWNKEAAVPKEVKEYAEEMIEANVSTLFEKEGKTIPKVFVSPGTLKKKDKE